TPTDSIVGLFGKKNLAKGVKVSVQEGEAAIEIEIAVKFGTSLREIAEKVQGKIKNAVETMTGLSVSVVDVNISAVVVEKTKGKEENEVQ
ncbi:MAG: Asp23/Gls24 family envelope stress response protein, partial [Lachnospiraceae bacterium]|nr:Asp23/Gls24 family envelope stress response protein [Lachnospiraceae bacterium]